MKKFFVKNFALSLILGTGIALNPMLAYADETKAEQPKAEEKKEEKKDSPKVEIKDDAVVANIDGEKVTIGDLRKSYKNLPPQIQAQASFEELLGKPKTYEGLLDSEITMRLVLKNAKKAGVDQRDEVKRKVADCQDNTVRRSYIEEKIEKRLTDDVLRKKFDEVLKMRPKDEFQVNIRMIVASTEAEANKALGRLKKGESFEAVAKDISIDPSKENGGSIGSDVWLTKDDLQQFRFSDSKASETIMKATKATNIDKAFKIESGNYIIVRVDDRRAMPVPKFEEVKTELKAMFGPTEMQPVIIEELKGAKIERFDMAGKALGTPSWEQKKEEPKAEKKEEAKTEKKS